MKICNEKILDVLKEKKGLDEIRKELKITKSEIKEAKKILNKLESEGAIEKLKQGKKIYYQLAGYNESKGETKDSSYGFLRILRKLDIADFAFVLIVLFVFILNFNLISEFKQLPSPMYGGDYYYHLGMMYHYDRGGSIFENSQLLNETPWAPFLYQEIIVYFSKLTGLDMIKSILYFSLPLLLISSVLIYLFSIYLFRDKLLSLIPVIFFCFDFPIFKYTPFGDHLIIPLFLFSVLVAIKKNKCSYWAVAGITYGFVGLTHTLGFVVCSIFVIVVMSYIYLLRYLNIDLKMDKGGAISFRNSISIDKTLILRNLNKNYKKTIVFFAVGILIAQVYWYKPIFIYHLNALNDLALINGYDLIKFGSAYMIDSFKSIFLNIFDISYPYGILNTFVSILFDIGLICLLIMRRKEFKYTYILLILAGMLIAIYHFVFTIPLIGKDFFSTLMLYHLFTTLKPLLFCYGLVMVSEKLNFGNNKKYLYVTVIVSLLILNFSAFNDRNKDDRWVQVGKQDMSPFIVEMSDWVKSNTEVNDVFISTNEHSFMLNGLTGNKVMNSRRAHSGMYVDVDRRWADSAVILYGNNSALRSELIKKYNVKYLYWQYDWITMDYQFDQSGRLVGWFDPFLIRDISNYSEYLSQNGISYNKMNTWLDPSGRDEKIRTFDVLFVLPSRWDQNKPWNPSLDNNLTAIKEFYQDGYLAARIYKIN